MTQVTTRVNVSDAKTRRDAIRAHLESMVDAEEQLFRLVAEARECDDHLALGYASWPACVAGEYAQLLAALDRDDRRLAVLALTETGLSSRAIAPLVGVSDRQVRRDLEQVGHGVPPARGRAPEAAVVGLDGRRYVPRPTSPASKRPRTSVRSAFWDRTHDVEKGVAGLERIAQRPTFAADRDALRASNLAELIRISNRLKKVIAALSSRDAS